MIDYFKSTIDKFNTYSDFLLKEHQDNEYLKSTLKEAYEKLIQINFLLNQQQKVEYCFIKSVMLHFAKMDGLINSDYKDTIDKSLFKDEQEWICLTNGKNNLDIQREVIIYTESIYYFAFSFQKKCKDIPGLKQFTPSGIRNVRNHIMEHPKEKFSNAFSITDSIHLKTGRYTYSESEDKWYHEDISIDKGLKSNMDEFKRVLENIINLRLEGK